MDQSSVPVNHYSKRLCFRNQSLETQYYWIVAPSGLCTAWGPRHGHVQSHPSLSQGKEAWGGMGGRLVREERGGGTGR